MLCVCVRLNSKVNSFASRNMQHNKLIGAELSLIFQGFFAVLIWSQKWKSGLGIVFLFWFGVEGVFFPPPLSGICSPQARFLDLTSSGLCYLHCHLHSQRGVSKADFPVGKSNNKQTESCAQDRLEGNVLPFFIFFYRCVLPHLLCPILVPGWCFSSV